MELKLLKPIVFFDLETTGINIGNDRIVEISMLKIFPNGNKESNTWLVNPEIEIPAETSAIHGITNERVVTEPTFKELAQTVYDMISDADLAGFNSNRFDIPLLAEEFLRAGLDFDMKGRKAIDVQVIFHKKEERTLSAGYKFYCDKDLENAHSAEADTLATYEILLAQLEKYDDLENNINFLNEYSTHNKRAELAGSARRRRETIGDLDIVAEVLTDANLNTAAILTSTQDSEVKTALITNTEKAVEKGLFGAPTMFVDNEMFFGQDRLQFVELTLQQSNKK